MTETVADILGSRLPPAVDRTAVDKTQMQVSRYDAGTRIPEVRRRRKRYDQNVEQIKADARQHLRALNGLYKQVSDQLNSPDGMKTAIREEAAQGYGVFLPAEVEELRAEVSLIADTLAELEARVRADLVI